MLVMTPSSCGFGVSEHSLVFLTLLGWLHVHVHAHVGGLLGRVNYNRQQLWLLISRCGHVLYIVYSLKEPSIMPGPLLVFSSSPALAERILEHTIPACTSTSSYRL